MDIQTKSSKHRLFQRRPRLALLFSIPIGALGGLIGLGGAEFRLPVLAGPLNYPARRAVPLNLAVSLVTLVASIVIRSRTLSLSPVVAYLPGVLVLTATSGIAAFFGVALAGKLSDDRLERIILVLLLGIGLLLIVEGFLPQQLPPLLPASSAWHIAAGASFGLVIGLVSSMLGVAGGELIIPTLVFAFGADIKTAGTASLIVSLPTVAVGVVRYARRGALTEQRDVIETILPMSLGSIIDAAVGGMLVGIIPGPALKVGLGLILNISALRVFHSINKRSSPVAR